MDTLSPTSLTIDPQHILATAVAHRIEHMTKEELQALVAKAQVDLQNENASLQRRIEELETENERLLYRISRSFFNEKDYENFDVGEYSVPMEEMLASARQRLKNS